MGIALPNGVEDGVHQLVKVALSSMVALFGTYQIAANGVAQSIWALASIMGLAMAPVYTTVIGQCMGARDVDAANLYFKKLNKITLALSILWNALVLAVTPLIVRYSAISPEAKELVIWLVLINSIFNGLACPFAGSLGNGLRAAGDVRFHGRVHHADHRRAAAVLGAVRPVAGLGRDRRGHRHEHRPCVPGRHLHLAAEVPEVDAVPADLSAAAPVKDIYITYD